MGENDPHRFESMARAVAEIPLDGAPAAVLTASEAGLRPALVDAAAIATPGPLKVEVMDPHELWDARDAGLRGAVEQAAPVITEAVLHQVADRMTRDGEPPSRSRTALPVDSGARETLQLGAFSSTAAARAAWRRISAAGGAVAALTPAFEAVAVDGRTLTRLKVTATSASARAVCRAADAADLGCLRRG